MGAAVVFLLNSVSFLAVIFVLYDWKRTPLFKSALPAERIFGSMRSGVRYVRHSPPLRAILLRTFLFTGFASAVWALLAVVAQQDLHAGAMAYGVLNGCLGLGAVIGALLLPRLRRKLPAEWMLAGAGVIFAVTLADPRPHPQRPADRLLAGGRRLRLDHHHLHAEYRGAAFRSGLGAGARARDLPDDLRRRNGRAAAPCGG